MGQMVTFESAGTPRPIAIDVDAIKGVFTKSELHEVPGRNPPGRAVRDHMILWVVVGTEKHDVSVNETFEIVMAKIAAARGLDQERNSEQCSAGPGTERHRVRAGHRQRETAG